MVDEVWLHIGTPKSGTSSLQKYVAGQRDDLSARGLAFIASDGRSSANDLAIAMNKKRDDLHDIAAGLNAQIEARPERVGLLSSEMLYGIAPQRIFDLLPALQDRPLNVLVYLRRQDKYIEAMFLQKSKNGRFFGTIGDYIRKFDGSGSDYARMLAPWRDHGHARLVPRVLEPGRLAQGNVVTDALAQMGLEPPQPPEKEFNVSPGFHRVQLLQVAAAAGVADLRKLQRRLAASYPQQTGERGPILTPEQRRGFLSQYEQGNAQLCHAYFADQDMLFEMGDLDHAATTGVPAFSKDQLTEISRLLEVIKSLQ